MVRAACPLTCGLCKSYISLAPSSSPSVSFIPSRSPTDLPSVLPTLSKAPSNQPSDMPSPAPSFNPSTTPSQRPTIECVNDNDFTIDGDPLKTCIWVRGIESRRAKQCKRVDVHLN